MPLLRPCSELSRDELIARAASCMDNNGRIHPPFALEPGRCRLCGTKLDAAFAATWVDDVGKAHHSRFSADSPESRAWSDEHGGLDFRGWRFGPGTILVRRKNEPDSAFPSILITVIASCECFTDDIHRAAAQRTRERLASLQKERAAREQAEAGEARRKAIAALKSNR